MDAVPPIPMDRPEVKVAMAQAYLRADQARDAILKPAFELFTLAEAPEAQLEAAEFVLEELARSAVAFTDTIAKRVEVIHTHLQSLEVAATGEEPGR